MSLLGDLSGGYSAGGSQNFSQSSGWSTTDASSARAWSEQQAAVAFERQRQLMQEQQAYNSAEAAIARQFNAEEAKKSRDWSAEMANTVYTRSVKNMIEAGINPILAANMGLSGANVGSGATASTSGATASMGSAPLAQNFMDSASGSQASGSGSSWNSSESGLAAGLQALGEMISGVLGNMNSSHTIDFVLRTAGDSVRDAADQIIDDLSGGEYKGVEDITGNAGGTSKGYFNGSSKHIDADNTVHKSETGRTHGGSYTKF